MNAFTLELSCGLRNINDVQSTIQRIQWEKLLENATQFGGPQHVYPLRNSFQRTSCIEINSFSNGRYYLVGTDNGSVALWQFDAAIVNETENSNGSTQRRLINRRVKVCKGKTPTNANRSNITTITRNQPSNYTNNINNDNSRLVHSFETKYNKFRLYRGNGGVSSMGSASSKQVGNNINQSSPSQSLQHHQYGITCMKWYGNDDGMFFTASHDKTIKIWDTNTFSAVQDIEFNYEVHYLDSIPSERNCIFVASDDYYPRMIDLRSMNLGVTIFGKSSKNSKITTMKSEILACKCNPIKDHIVASSDNDGRIKLWDLRMRNQLLMELQHHDSRFNNKAHVKPCNDLTWTEDGKYLISIGLDGKILKWEPFNTSLLEMVTQIGDTDVSRNKYTKRTSQRLLSRYKYLIVNTDYSELQIFDTEQNKFWNKIDYPTDLLNEGDGNEGMFCGMSAQTDLSNSTGLRLLVGANSIHSTKSDLRNNILEFTC
ncbi:similar to Saccharomyces cerevisiae YDR030C RAD28 Protein involved in DNA repair [Maudiozyma saulgeensis]|uniref:Similar to Saccharomyces cerevisiae YDR030C RAD28 Protein involved in DNA repair n=1 Tax=Maudiozyma saulgeensis TaxID=1789683 RepID=A0A1X7R4F9_9SACH|nr:similar to Saccharomyces cerevisiae YDR030C RAD28 Protein involved in DNA repair [Kazachstania saulgeensis]